jgi:hypothetical protein
MPRSLVTVLVFSPLAPPVTELTSFPRSIKFPPRMIQDESLSVIIHSQNGVYVHSAHIEGQVGRFRAGFRDRPDCPEQFGTLRH